MSLVFYAATYNNQTFECLEVPVGTGPATYTTPADLLLPDFEGLYHAFPTLSAPWHGSRVVTNLAIDGDTIDSSANWQRARVVTTGISDPRGGTDAYSMAVDGLNQQLLSLSTAADHTGERIVSSIWLRSTAGTQTINLYTGRSTNTTPIEITSEWRKYSAGPQAGFTSGDRVGFNSGSSSDPIEFYIPQFEIVTSQANENPSESVASTAAVGIAHYANLNGNTVSSNVVTEAAGALLDPLPSLYAAPAYQNEFLQSQDLSQAPWALSGDTTAVFDQTGLDGSPNSATLLEDLGALSNSWATQTVAGNNGATGEIWTVQAFVKKDTDQTRFPAVWVFTNAAQAKYQLNTQTGAVVQLLGTPSEDSVAIDRGLWWEWLVSYEITSNGAAGLRLFPADGSVFGSSSNAATGSVVVGNISIQEDKAIPEVLGSAPIVTAGSKVSTVAVTDTYPPGNHSDMQGGWYVDVIGQTDTGVADGFLNIVGANYQLTDGVTPVTRPFTAQVGSRVGAPYGGGLYVLNVDAVVTADTAYDGTLLSGNLDFGRAAQGVLLHRNIRRYDDDFAASKAIISQLMVETDTGFPIIAPTPGGNLPDLKNIAVATSSTTDTSNTDTDEQSALKESLGYPAITIAASVIASSNNLLGEDDPGELAWDPFSEIILGYGVEDGLFGPGTASTAEDQSVTAAGVYRLRGTVVTNHGPFPSVATYRFYFKKDAAQSGLYMRWFVQSTPGPALAAYTVEYNTGAVDLISDDYISPVIAVDDGALTGHSDFWALYYQFAPRPVEDQLLFPGASPAYTAVPGGGSDITQTGTLVHGNLELYLNRTMAEIRELRTVGPTTAYAGDFPGIAVYPESLHVNDMWRALLDLRGFTTGNNNTDLYNYLGSLGYTGHINERLRDWYKTGVPLSASL